GIQIEHRDHFARGARGPIVETEAIDLQSIGQAAPVHAQRGAATGTQHDGDRHAATRQHALASWAVAAPGHAIFAARTHDDASGEAQPAASFVATSATSRPWKRAPSSSLSLGWRDPSPPAMVEAP